MLSWRTSAKAILAFVAAIAYTPIATPAQALAAADPGRGALAAVSSASAQDSADEDDPPADGDDDADAPPPCLPGNAPSAVTGRCVPDFPEHVCPDGGMSIWNRCPQSDPCVGGGASVNGQCPGPTERFCDEGVSFEGSCGEDRADEESFADGESALENRFAAAASSR
ncbi:hypothetical protein Srot_2017 [Segniliparus rotundus DSM 44985]|uniref:Uncharacterized protein n=1 Tax=Segniliparus rotundus (strain ATCC BAA-972 / CDC 1076 / CIP 108378 / DSM 44985 / JCM 13578) TaxID=640132 RepID=D6Z943_SEGRD|nr:hypothetical protein [Segniliparus rotundus]ADG98473.1 hypothetical protein Srot_2017 [Segniliparus rotundus DSM 44985]